jgi:hypothetical protein
LGVLLLLVVLLLNVLISIIRRWREAREERGVWQADWTTDAVIVKAGAR